jgi:hypothetical protein
MDRRGHAVGHLKQLRCWTEAVIFLLRPIDELIQMRDNSDAVSLYG